MPAVYAFHPDALSEFAEATDFYIREASTSVAEAFLRAVESAINTLIAAPTRWRVVESPGIRRFVLKRFPFVLYYRWDTDSNRVTIFAIMHTSREPGYWQHRVKSRPET
jgi:plasmid stabilization system protein ParE